MRRDFYKTYFNLEKDNWWFRVRRNVIQGLLKKYAINTDDKVLDYGCGSGFLVEQLQNQGHDAYGVDTSKEAIDFGVTKGIRNLFQQNGIKVNFPDNYFDVILAMDVIEHIEDDRSAIEEFERLLKPEGHLIITVPAYQWLWGVQDEVAHHFRRYTMSGLTDTINRSSNLKIVRKTYFNTFLFLPIAVVRILSKWFNLKERESDFDINSRFSNNIFYFIFNLEAYFLKFFSFSFGVSILLVLKKND